MEACSMIGLQRRPPAAALVFSRNGVAIISVLFPTSLRVAGTHGIDGAQLRPWRVLPFAGMALSIALLPLLAVKDFPHHGGKISPLRALTIILPLLFCLGLTVTADQLLRVLFLDNLSFIALTGTLFTIAGCMCIGGNLRGSPHVDTGLLGAGMILASVLAISGAPAALQGPLATLLLLTISAWAVFMGANTYSRNVASFALKSIAKRRGRHYGLLRI
jgi:hypothetical protein